MKLSLTVENTVVGLMTLEKLELSFRKWDGTDRAGDAIVVTWLGLVQSTAALLTTAVISDESVLVIRIERE